LDVPLKVKGTPCSGGDHAPFKSLSKRHYLTRNANPAERVRA